MINTSVLDCKLITLDIQKYTNNEIVVFNSKSDVNFSFKRIYYLYDVPEGESRGGHAHKNLKQLIISVSGSFDLVVDDGKIKKTFKLSKPNEGFLMPSGLWRELENFSNGAICLVLASEVYDENDYIRNYNDFTKYKK